MKLLNFVGPKGSGKDTAANILKANKLIRDKIAFAGPLKKLCSEVFNIPYQYMHDQNMKEKEFDTPIILDKKVFRKLAQVIPEYLDPAKYDYNPYTFPVNGIEGVQLKTTRQLLQFIGTEVIRDRIHKEWHPTTALNPEYLAKVIRHFNDKDLYAITDCRFLNELSVLSNYQDVKHFYIERPEAEEKLSKATHSSELEILKVKEIILENGGEIITNDGTQAEFEEKVLSILAESGGKRGRKKSKTSRS